MSRSIETLDQEMAQSFAKELIEDVLEEVTKPESEFPDATAAFAFTASQSLREEGAAPEMISLPISTRYGNDHLRMTGYAEVDDLGCLHLFAAKFVEDPSTALGSEDLKRLVSQAVNCFRHVASLDRGMDPDMESARGFARHVVERMDRIQSIKILVIFNGRIVGDHAKFKVGNVKGHVEMFDATRLYRLSGQTPSRQDIKVTFDTPLPALEATPEDYEYKTYLLLLDGQCVHFLVERFGHRLYETNVRAHLGVKTPINRGMTDTIRNEPGNFLAFNNGLCATAEGIDVEVRNGQPFIRGLVGLQIVNGAQTTSTIHKAGASSDVSKVSVPVKLTIVKPDSSAEFIPQISKYANSQNAIQQSDIHANRDLMIRFQSGFKDLWCPGERTQWYFERTRGSFSADLQRETPESAKNAFKVRYPKALKFSKTDLAKYVLAWDGYPHIVSRGSQEAFRVMFKDMSARLATGELNVDEAMCRDTLAKAIMLKAAAREGKRQKLAYVAATAAYAVAYLAHRHGGDVSLGEVWRRQEPGAALKETLARVVTHVDAVLRGTAEGRNVTQWAKQEDCWKAIAASTIAGHAFQGELLLTPDADSAPADWRALSNRDLCERLDADKVGDLLAWIEEDARYGAPDLSNLRGIHVQVGQSEELSPSDVELLSSVARTALEEGRISMAA